MLCTKSSEIIEKATADPSIEQCGGKVKIWLHNHLTKVDIVL